MGVNQNTAKAPRFLVAVAALTLLGPLGCPERARRQAPQPPPRTYASASYPILDIHTHLDPDATTQVLQLFDARNIRVAVNLSGGLPGNGIEEALVQQRASNNRIIPFCVLPWSRAELPNFTELAVDALERCHSMGIRGLKIPKSLGLIARDVDGSRLHIDAPRLDPIFETCGRLGMVVLIHSGDPRAFFQPANEQNERWEELREHPRWSFHGMSPFGWPFPTFDEVLSEFERRVLRHPNTTFIGAHFGNAAEDPDRVERLLERAPNYYIDTAARVPEFGRHSAARMRQFFLRWRERILFGTDLQLGREMAGWHLGSGGDAPTTQADVDRFFTATYRYFESNDQRIENPTPIQGRWTINSIGLPESVLRAVYGGNAARLLHIEWPPR